MLKSTVALIAIALLFNPISTAINAPACDPKLAAAGLCGTNDGTSIIIDGTHTNPGSPGNPGTSPIGNTNPGTNLPWYPPAEFNFASCLNNWDSYVACFRAQEEEVEADDPAPDEPGMPAVTIADLAQFAPGGSILAGEPDNVGVAGLPTNFVATASAHTVDGTLFGFPIAVRFTPSSYDFNFGDGTSATTTAGGRSWESLGQAQFTPTPTSHAYAERGNYFASVDVRYTAEIDLGVGWFPINGEVTAAGSAQEIRIFEAHTALVAYTCGQAPDSPGC